MRAAYDESGSDAYQLALYIASGVTSIRHVGGSFQTLSGPFHSVELERNGAVLGQSDLGWLRPGYLADLIVVDGNPLANLQVLYASGTPVWNEEGQMSQEGGIRYTIIGGHVYDAQEVLANVARMVREGQ